MNSLATLLAEGMPSENNPVVPARRLLSITRALQLSGAPTPDAARLVLLARYVTGRTTLHAILPDLKVPLTQQVPQE